MKGMGKNDWHSSWHLLAFAPEGSPTLDPEG